MGITGGRRGRSGEFTDFAAQAQDRLFRQAVLLTGDREAAHDLVQNTLVKMYVAWPRVESPAAYAQRTMVRTFLDDRRKVRREAELWRPIDGRATEHDPAQTVTVREAIASLPPRMRAVVVLRYWEDLPVDRVADLLGCSPGTVKSSASRGLDHLRVLLGETVAGEHASSTPSSHQELR